MGWVPVDACDRWPHESNLPTTSCDVHMQRIRLWLLEKGPTASGLSFTCLQHSWLPFLNPRLCQPGCFKCKKVEKATVSLSYIIHQVAITAADRTVYPRRPCVLPASAEVRLTLPPDWTLAALTVVPQPLNIYVCAACCRPWGLTKRRKLRKDKYQVSFDWNERRGGEKEGW